MVPDDIANLVGEELCTCTQFLCVCEGRGGEGREGGRNVHEERKWGIRINMCDVLGGRPHKEQGSENKK